MLNLSSETADIKTIAIVGAGQMGAGIAYVAAVAGYQVKVIDIKSSQLELARKSLQGWLQKQQERGKLSSDQSHLVNNSLLFSESLTDCAQADIVIEAVIENLALKQLLLKDICTVLKPEGLIASNTSSLSLTQLASATQRPDKVIGMHFMNPVPVMGLVEVIQGLHTSPETFSLISHIIKRMGKTMVVSKDTPGFIVNRILMPMINEAIFALYEGIATAQDIDEAMKMGTNQPLGPLALADLIGLDTCLSIMQVLHNGFGDSKYRPCPLLVTYVAAGWLGRKTGKGFYSYTT